MLLTLSKCEAVSPEVRAAIEGCPESVPVDVLADLLADQGWRAEGEYLTTLAVLRRHGGHWRDHPDPELRRRWLAVCREVRDSPLSSALVQLASWQT